MKSANEDIIVIEALSIVFAVSFVIWSFFFMRYYYVVDYIENNSGQLDDQNLGNNYYLKKISHFIIDLLEPFITRDPFHIHEKTKNRKAEINNTDRTEVIYRPPIPPDGAASNIQGMNGSISSVIPPQEMGSRDLHTSSSHGWTFMNQTQTVNFYNRVVALPGFLKIDLRNFSIQEVIAKGGTAIVMKGRLKPEENIAEDVLNRFKNQDIVAIKIMKRPPAIPEDEFVRSVHQEISIMYAMETYPNIIQLLAFCEKPFAIITKLYAGNLSSELKNAADLKWNNELIKLNMAYDVAKGISYLHDNGIIHNDLKPANILIEFDLLDKEKERPIGVISDFGISGLLEEDVKGRNKSNVIGASVAYAAPEILILQDDSSMTQDKIGSVQSDLYSYAMILYELVTRNPPFKNYSVNSVLRDAIISGDRPVLIQSEREHHPFLVTLIEANWQQSAKSRMQSFADVLSLLDAAMSRTMQQ